jgi:hypothetical protein
MIPGDDVAWTKQCDPIAVAQYDIASGAQLGPEFKLGRICVLTREVAEHTSGLAAITTLLREDVGASLDKLVFSDTAAVAGVSQAGLLAGLSPLTRARRRT